MAFKWKISALPTDSLRNGIEPATFVPEDKLLYPVERRVHIPGGLIYDVLLFYLVTVKMAGKIILFELSRVISHVSKYH